MALRCNSPITRGTDISTVPSAGDHDRCKKRHPVNQTVFLTSHAAWNISLRPLRPAYVRVCVCVVLYRAANKTKQESPAGEGEEGAREAAGGGKAGLSERRES